MNYNVGQLKDGVAGLLSGTNVDRVTGVYKVFERAARKLVQKADIPEATGKYKFDMYAGVYDYLAPEQIFGGAVVDVRQQGVSRWYGDKTEKLPVEFFDRNKGILASGTAITFEYEDGLQIMRIVTNRALLSAGLDYMESTTGWTAGGSIASVSQDTTDYYSIPASLRFTLTGDDVGTLTKTITTMNLESFRNVGVAFLAVKIPTGATLADLAGIEARIGSSATAYDSVSVTSGYLGAWKLGSWLLLAFDMAASTSTGTPDWTAINYLQLRLTHASTFTNFRVGGMWIALPVPHEMIYQTSALFVSNGTRGLTITDDEDTIVLNDAAYNIYEHECALGVAVQQNMDKKANTIRTILYGKEGTNDEGLYAEYRGDNPSQEIRTVGSYYDC